MYKFKGVKAWKLMVWIAVIIVTYIVIVNVMDVRNNLAEEREQENLTILEVAKREFEEVLRIESDSKIQNILFQQEKKVEELKKELLSTLGEQCETLGVKEPDSALVFDSNNEASIGRYQYQRDTVIYYYKKLYGEDIGRTEAIAIAIDKERASVLTLDILFLEENGWKNWWNCSQRHDIPTTIKWIKRIAE